MDGEVVNVRVMRWSQILSCFSDGIVAAGLLRLPRVSIV
jgi:hypothetical protein